MTIDYQALREAAECAIPEMELLTLPFDAWLSKQELKDYGVDIDVINTFRLLAGPETMLELLDEIKRLEDTNIDAMCQIAELEASRAALSAENALARKAVQAFCDVVGDSTEVICEEVGRDGVLVILEAMKATGNMPATDAFLSEVRAQGVEMLAKNHQSIVNAPKGDSLFSDGEYRHAIIASAATSFAAELRKGGNQ
ncbi:hypothetical protein HmCmsJML183_04353 [Escherichia coli]|nr:ead/Ea22-like family protein [Escherichia coli]GDA11869.1 hypothetical protein HmCmsJML183_04353 [Escherichia coli]